jgi:hypothetical protein
MIQTIIDYLNLRVETLGRIAHLYGITEKRKRSGDDTAIPYAYVGAGQFEPVDIDNGNAGWWRPRSGFTMEPVEVIGRAVKQQRASYPLRFVAVLRRDLSVADDAFMPSRLAEDISNALNFDNGDLRNILKALNVEARTSSVEFDASAIWATEFHTSIPDLHYELAMVAVDVTVEVVAKYSCWEGECATDLDILRLFNFCDPAVVARLTPAQVACLEAALCEAPPTLCEQLAEVQPADVVADVFDCLTKAAQDELLSTECADGTVNITNTDADPIASVTVASGGVEPYVIPNVIWTNSDGSAESTPYGDAIVCDMAAGGDVTVTVSDATPSTGDTITITATASGFTPTNYLFFSYDGVTIEEIVDQASGVYNWFVDRAGTYDIYVLATDGTTSAYGTVEVVAASGYVLDLITPQPVWAVSLRKLKAAYTGDAAIVRRSSDNATLGIGFIGENLDTAALIAHVGIGNGFTATLYDQIGGVNATQVNAGNQPSMVIGGTVQMLGGRPTIVFNGTSQEMVMSSDITLSHGFVVARKASNTNFAQFVLGGTAQGLNFGGTFDAITANIIVSTPSGLLVSAVNDTLPHQISLRLGVAGSGRLRVDGVTQATGTTSASMIVSRIGTRPDTSLRHVGDFSEAILYASVLSDANELLIENNQRAYYGL